MAFINNLGVITLDRGDCFKTPLFINIGTQEEPIRFNILKFPEAELYFGVYNPGDKFENSFIAKKFNYLDSNPQGDVIISLNSEDTLHKRPGAYLYSIKIRMFDPTYGEWISTVINENNFYIV